MELWRQEQQNIEKSGGVDTADGCMPRTPLWGAVCAYNNLDRASFHTPGHKCADFFPPSLLKADLTELPETDALYEADGAILAAEKELARVFGAKRTLISAGGCTLAIQTMLRLVRREGRVLCSRVLHRGAVNAMALLGIEPVWLVPEKTSGCFDRVSPKSVMMSLKFRKDIDAVYITSPDYYGRLSDIEGISAVCREYDIPLIVDNAHGSHLAFGHQNLHPLHLGASMTACSMHKTLPVLTGGAVLNIADERYVDGAKSAMALFGSTSPSYPLMCSIDLCAGWLSNGGAATYAGLEDTVLEIKTVAAERGLSMPSGLCDPLRICLNMTSIGMNGDEGGEYFRQRGIEPEMYDKENIVFICTPFNTPRDFARLKKAILSLPVKPPLVHTDEDGDFTLPKRAMTLREAVLCGREKIPTEKAEGRIAAEAVCPCPPGIPVVMPGELIDRDCIRRLILGNIHELMVTCHEKTALLI